MALHLPKYSATKRQARWVADKVLTASLIRSLWIAASGAQRHDPEFLSLLVQCGWSNIGGNNGTPESTLRWRNEKIADYLGESSRQSDEGLATALTKRFPTLKQEVAFRILRAPTGIAHYRNSFRAATEQFVKDHADRLSIAFKRVVSVASNSKEKVNQVAVMIERLGKIDANGRQISPFNGLTPTLACLDPQRRFPIMNQKTRSLLRGIDKEPNADGVVALYELIGRDNNVKDSFELDAYACGEKFEMPQRTRSTKNRSKKAFRDVGLKSEINSIAMIDANRKTITKQHNILTNRLRNYLLWRHITASEDKFDILIKAWKKGRDLLIEAKTASEGPAGRAQVRQAIGQLFDYRFSFLPRETVDLAVLLANKPSSHVQELLASLDIGLLWFEGTKLKGTIRL